MSVTYPPRPTVKYSRDTPFQMRIWLIRMGTYSKYSQSNYCQTLFAKYQLPSKPFLKQSTKYQNHITHIFLLRHGRYTTYQDLTEKEWVLDSYYMDIRQCITLDVPIKCGKKGNTNVQYLSSDPKGNQIWKDIVKYNPNAIVTLRAWLLWYPRELQRYTHWSHCETRILQGPWPFLTGCGLKMVENLKHNHNLKLDKREPNAPPNGRYICRQCYVYRANRKITCNCLSLSAKYNEKNKLSNIEKLHGQKNKLNKINVNVPIISSKLRIDIDLTNEADSSDEAS